MQDILSQSYLWLKAFHVIAVIAWMAGLLYLPRLFVYHAGAEKGSALSETLKTMERRLYRFIMTPAFIAAWTFGVLMIASNPAIMKEGWIHVKLSCVVLLTGAHHVMGAHVKKFGRDENVKSAKFFRILNEIPTILMIVIVIMVIVRPF
jgi:protoporphyrinogen IX oxidase